VVMLPVVVDEGRDLSNRSLDEFRRDKHGLSGRADQALEPAQLTRSERLRVFDRKAEQIRVFGALDFLNH